MSRRTAFSGRRAGIRGGRVAGFLAISLASLCALGAAGASAATFEVKSGLTPTEAGEALTKVVAEANAKKEANTIVLGTNIYQPTKTLTLTNTAGAQTFEGPVGTPTTKTGEAKIDGSNVKNPLGENTELFVVDEKVSVTFKNIEITHAGGPSAYAIADSGALDFERSLVAGNNGDAILVAAKATPTGTSGTLTATNSTFSDGANFAVIDDGTASFFNSTIAFNAEVGIENAGTLNLTNTIVADNTAGDCVGKATTSDHSLDSDETCGVELSGKNPELQKGLFFDGGSTPLHSLKPGSPAIGAGDETKCPATDQRGAPRANPCSIGADEYSSTPPTITVPSAPLILEADEVNEGGEEGIVLPTSTVTATGVNGTIHELVCTPDELGEFAVVTAKIKEECTAVDGHENKVSGDFELEVKAKSTAPPEPPKFSNVPGPIVQPATSPSGAVVMYTDPTATDPKGGTDAVTCLPKSGSTFPIAATKVVCTAETTEHVKGEASFEVMVTENPPEFSGVPATIELEAAENEEAVVTYTNPTATDPAGGTDEVTCTPPSGSSFKVGTTAVTCTATSKAGSGAMASFEVKVTKHQTVPSGPPVFSGVPATVEVEAAENEEAVVTYTNPTATDPAGGTDAVTCTPPSGSSFKVGSSTVKCTAETKAGVSGEASFEVKVTKHQTVPSGPPVFSGVPANITITATSSSGAVVTYTNPTATDPASGSDAVTCTPPSGSTFPVGTTKVVCIAETKAGVSGETSFEITVTPKAPVEVVSPVIQIGQLLHSVSTSRVAFPIRFQLSALLLDALHSLSGPVFFGGFDNPLSAQLAPLTGWYGGGRHVCTTQRALNDLAAFIAVIEHDQQRGRWAQIPPYLASAWITAAQSIEASLSCQPSPPPRHYHGR